MEINIGGNLKELRKKKSTTQEDLANFLTVSIAAVSKWERGECYPDIEFLPRLAVFYGTTVDDLLGVGEARKQQKFKEYYAQEKENAKKGDGKADIALWRSAAKEIPNDDAVMWMLMQALSNMAGNTAESNRDEYHMEVIEIGEALSAKYVYQDMSYIVLERLCYAYKETGEVEKAKKTADKLPSSWSTRDFTLGRILEGGELKAHVQTVLHSLIVMPFGNMVNTLAERCGYGEKQQIRIYEKMIQILKLFFEDGDYGALNVLLWNSHSSIAEVHAKTGNAGAAIENLQSAAKHATAYDALEENTPHTSLFFDMVAIQKYSVSIPKNEAWHLLEKMASDCYDFCRGDERFEKIRSGLTAVAREDKDAHP